MVDASRNVMLIGKERHDLGRPNDWGYPVRAIRTPEFLYVRNYPPGPLARRQPRNRLSQRGRRPHQGRSSSPAFDEYYQMSFGKRPPRSCIAIRTDPIA